jgi:hypothetical protein
MSSTSRNFSVHKDTQTYRSLTVVLEHIPHCSETFGTTQAGYIDKESSILERKRAFIVTQQRVGLSHNLLSEPISLIVELGVAANTNMYIVVYIFYYSKPLNLRYVNFCFECCRRARRHPALTFGYVASKALSIS